MEPVLRCRLCRDGVLTGGAGDGVGPGDGPGCLGVTVAECVAWLRATMTLDENFLAQAMARRHEVDVNGQPLGSGLVDGQRQIAGPRSDQFVLLLHLRPGRHRQAASNPICDPT